VGLNKVHIFYFDTIHFLITNPTYISEYFSMFIYWHYIGVKNQ
jgi:hypothetical protein